MNFFKKISFSFALAAILFGGFPSHVQADITINRAFSSVPYTTISYSQNLLDSSRLPLARHTVACEEVKDLFATPQTQRGMRNSSHEAVRKLFAIFDEKVSTSILLTFKNPEDNVHVSCSFDICNSDNDLLFHPVPTLKLDITGSRAELPGYALNLLTATSTPDGLLVEYRGTILSLALAACAGAVASIPKVMRAREPKVCSRYLTLEQFEEFIKLFDAELAQAYMKKKGLKSVDSLKRVVKLKTTDPVIPAAQRWYDSTWKVFGKQETIPSAPALAVIGAPYRGSLSVLAEQGVLSGNEDKKQLRILVTTTNAFSINEVLAHAEELKNNNWVLVIVRGDWDYPFSTDLFVSNGKNYLNSDSIPFWCVSKTTLNVGMVDECQVMFQSLDKGYVERKMNFDKSIPSKTALAFCCANLITEKIQLL